MRFTPAELVAELCTLRRGRGVQTMRIGGEIGPALRELCGVRPTDTHALIRQKVSRALHDHSERMPADLRTVFRTALGLCGDGDGQFLNDRTKLLAGEFNRNIRTIRRRIEEAINHFAESATIDGQREAVLRLDLSALDSPARHKILAECDRMRAAVVVPAARVHLTGDDRVILALVTSED